MTKIRITHVINPVRIGTHSDLNRAQPITFQSVKIAKELARLQGIEVELLSVQYEEDKEIIPSYFKIAPSLVESVLDYGEFMKPRKLPLVRQILEKAYECSEDSEYIVYTNVDISVQPYFYVFIAAQVDKKLDAFVINRRTISNDYARPEELPLMYAEIGAEHPGYDCFVFKRSLYTKFELGNICVGAVYIGLSLYLNLRLNAESFREFGDEHLTFHIGNDQHWRDSDNDSFKNHNESEFTRIKEMLSKKHGNVASIIALAFPGLKSNKQKTRNWIQSFISYFKN